MKKRSIVVSGHSTSITLEDAFWDALKDIAKQRQISISILITEVDAARDTQNLSSALRLYVLHMLQEKIKNLL